jgi:hypothetical protein
MPDVETEVEVRLAGLDCPAGRQYEASVQALCHLTQLAHPLGQSHDCSDRVGALMTQGWRLSCSDGVVDRRLRAGSTL